MDGATSHNNSSKKYYAKNIEQERERSRIRMRELRRKRKEAANASQPQPVNHDDPSSSSQSEDEDCELTSLQKKIESIPIAQPQFPLIKSLLADPPINPAAPTVPQKWSLLPHEVQVDWAGRFLDTHPRHHTFIREMLAHQEKGLEMVLRFSEDLISENYEEMQQANSAQPEGGS